MDYLENLELIKHLGNEILKPRSYCYSQEMVAEYLRQYRDIKYEALRVTNDSGENLKVSLFVRGEASEICIVFMHGLGSTRLEGLNLLKQMPDGYSLCVFDFSGSGKSEGSSVTYGMKEKHDIQSVLKVLRPSYSKFVLWGRSMGAVSALLHAKSYCNPSDVIMMVLDSPFSSFENITKELALRKVKVPAFVINLLLDLVRANFKKLTNNPFEIDFSDCSDCRIPSLFIYSDNDDVVSSSHTHKILSNFKAKYDKFIISQNHNAPRSRQTLKKIFNSIEVCRQNDVCNNTASTTNTSMGFKRKAIFTSQRDISIKKGRGINIVSRQKSVKNEKRGFLQRRNTPSCLSSLGQNDYYIRSTELQSKSKKTRSPPRRILSDFYSCLQDEIAYSLTQKITQKMMLSNHRYL